MHKRISRDLPARPDEMRKHPDRHPRPYQGHFRRREQAAGLRFGGADQPAAHVLRRADLRPRLLHGPERRGGSQVSSTLMRAYLKHCSTRVEHTLTP